MELEKNNLSINQIATQKLDTIICEGDCIVPDIKPDLLSIITTSGIVNVYKKEIMDGKVRIDGAVNTYTMYIAEEEGKKQIRSINYILDFSQVINLEAAKADMLSDIEVSLKNVESKIINERKISVKAMLELDIKLYTNNSEEFITGIKDIKDLQKMEQTMIVNSLMGNEKTKAQAKETIAIDSIDNLAEILKVNLEIVNRDTKISYNKILAKADTKLKILYLTDDGRINTVSTTIPIMGFIDMKDISEENVCDVQYEIKNMIIKPNGMQEHSIYVEIEVEISAQSFETKEINIIQDLYSPSTNLEFEQKDVIAMQDKRNYKNIYNIREKQMIDIGDEKVYDADLKLEIENYRILKDSIEINGNLNIQFVHSVNNMQEIGISQMQIPIEYNMPCNGMKPNNNIKINTDIPLQDFTILPNGEIDIKIDLEISINTSTEVKITKICNVKECEEKDKKDYNMVIYFTKKDDTLWKIAKEFKSTMESIKCSNELASDEITPGMQLFITKYVGVNG